MFSDDTVGVAVSEENVPSPSSITSFSALAVQLGLYFVLFVIALSMFEIAVHFNLNRLFSPRSYARPKQIIQNQLKHGPYCINWIPWSLRLSYSQMMEGVKGTGTRNCGWSGSNLRCNLDGVILIKFCVLCLKVSVLATFLCIIVILPVNYTASCNPTDYDTIDIGQSICENRTEYNNYGKCTYANIPKVYLGQNYTWYSHQVFIDPFRNGSSGTTFRMIAILAVACILYIYTCVLIWEEWIQNLALRRVYYLEYNHYKHRKDYLEGLENLKDREESYVTDRPVFVPHPELSDTVPNIGLYSVLFRLPGIQLVSKACDGDSNVEHQLQVAIEFFDKVVPNQPGYSSSVAALTILPDVKRLSLAWKKWFECASKVRRLKFIREKLEEARNGPDFKTKPDNTDIDSYNECRDNHNTKFNSQQRIKSKTIINCSKLDTVQEASYIDEFSAPQLEFTERSSNNEEESQIEMFLDNDEIEQMTVYYREFARSSASCGPYGCDEYSIANADILTLTDIEQEAAEEVEIAIEELRQARIDIRSDKKPSGLRFHNVIEMRSIAFPQNGHLYDSAKDNVDLDEGTNVSEHNFPLWDEADLIVGSEQYFYRRGGETRKRHLNSGRCPNSFAESTSRRVVGNIVPSGVLSRIIKNESYAVVTFTSRQAAIAARQCVADGSGLEGWKEIDKIPIPPLADAVPWNISDCRGCCRPVTVTLPRSQKGYRFKIMLVFLISFTVLWTYPYVLLVSATTPERLRNGVLANYPFLSKYAEIISMMTKSFSMMGLFAVLPQIFKALANFGSGATSILEAERHALFYYWWFMIIFAFGSITLGNSIIAAFQNNDVNVITFSQILVDLANAVPIQTASYWMGWIIQQTLMVLPFMYFLQFNNFLFTLLQWDCCARASAGGGPGGVVPYRIYVNLGIIFLCVVSLAPLNPIIAPFSMLCLMFMVPMLKWSLIFVYRPIFDAGGMRWPELSDMMMTAVFGSQILLSISFILKQGFVVGFFSLLSMIPTSTFKSTVKETFGESYSDAGLLQTSELDGWDVRNENSMTERERYRKWLVDCHKASYVPICVNAEDNFLTSEPAVVIPTNRDQDIDIDGISQQDSNDLHDQTDCLSSVETGRPRLSTLDSFNSFRSQRNITSQRGALFRRVVGSIGVFHAANEDLELDPLILGINTRALSLSPNDAPMQTSNSSKNK